MQGVKDSRAARKLDERKAGRIRSLSTAKSRDDCTELGCDLKRIMSKTVAHCFLLSHMAQLRTRSFASRILGPRHKHFSNRVYAASYVYTIALNVLVRRLESKDSRIQKQFSVYGVALDKRHVLLEGCERLSSRGSAKVSWYRFKENLEPRVVFERRTGGK